MKRACVLLFAICALNVIALRATDSMTINGWISDSMCGAKHAGTGKACVIKCIKSGLAPVFVDEGKKEVWNIDNPEAVKDFWGDHVTITASMDAAKKSLRVDTITEVK